MPWEQDSLILLRGPVGNLSFYKSRLDGYLVRKKSTLSAERVKSDPAFGRTLENASEFARAAGAGKLLRRALQSLLGDISDKRVTSRLTGAMVKVIKGDTKNARVQRHGIISVDGGVSKERLTDETSVPEAEEAPIAMTAVPKEAEEKVYATNWSYSASPFGSIACSFSGDLHHAYAYTDDSLATASTVTTQETEPTAAAPSRTLSHRNAMAVSPGAQTIPDKSRRPLTHIAKHRPDSAPQTAKCGSRWSGGQSKPQERRPVKKETG